MRPFEELVAEAYEPLQRYLRRRTDPGTADDVLGDVLLVMWRRAADIPHEAELAWCYGVARGCLANATRASDRRLKLVRRLVAEPAPGAVDADPDLHEALQALPPKDAEVLRLWAWEQLTASEIATVLGITPNAASIRLHRATKKLKIEWSKRKKAGTSGQPVGRQGEEDR
ncbi:MAG: sigma-70 family RNA polymerase sigma factor [Mycobacteriales bacterium]